jgi:hypothetical protein
MLVKVKTNFIGQLELDIETPTLKKVLVELSKRNRIPLLDPDACEVHSDFKIYLNGIEYERLPDRIDTELRNGDQVEVNLIMLAGG